MKNVLTVSTTTIKGEFIPTFGVCLDDIGVVNTAIARISVADLKFLPTEANPRSFHEGPTTKKIEGTITSEPQLFEVLNRGLTIVCSKCEYEKGEVKFTFTDKSQGLVDGGHSYNVALRNKNANAKIIIKVIYGDGAEILATRISETFNTSEKVKEMSLNNLRGYFDFIKKSIINEDYFFSIKWEENENKPIPCTRIIGLLNSFDPDRWGHGEICNRVPSDSYNSARHTQLDFASKYKKYGESTDNPYYAMKNVIPEIIALFDFVENNFIRIFNKSGSKKYKDLTVTLPDKSKTKLININEGKMKTTFSLIENTGYVPSGYVYPLIAPMRIFMERDKDGFWYFITDPRLIFDQIGPQLIRFALEYYTIWDPKSALKDPKFWTYLYDKTILLKNSLK